MGDFGPRKLSHNFGIYNFNFNFVFFMMYVVDKIDFEYATNDSFILKQSLSNCEVEGPL